MFLRVFAAILLPFSSILWLQAPWWAFSLTLRKVVSVASLDYVQGFLELTASATSRSLLWASSLSNILTLHLL